MSKLIRLLDRITQLMFNTSAVLLAVAAVLVFYQVFTRFILGQAAAWSEISARAVIIWGVFLVLGPAIRHNRMIPIDSIRSLFPPTKLIWLIRTVNIAIFVVLLVLIWFGGKMTLRVAHQQVAMMNFSVAWFYAALPIGSLLAIPGLFLANHDAEIQHRNLSESPK